MPQTALIPGLSTQLTTAPIVIPPLNEGEVWAGIVSVGTQLHHIILLPGTMDAGTWSAAKAWAKKHHGDLPTRLELSLLWANLNDQFERDWYWSGEQHASYPSYAWVQSFGFGNSIISGKDYGGRARAVRRLKI